jgi:polygalacturonase
MKLALLSLALLTFAGFAQAAGDFDITKYGATPDDATDDTVAISRALSACREAGGGTVTVPAGTFIISRQKSETPILEIPGNTTFRGLGDKSVLKFSDAVNGTNFWRLLGVSRAAHDIQIRDLHLDGSTTATEYVKGKTAEHNHGMFFYSTTGPVEKVTIENCLIENFSGDCLGLSRGCRGFTVRGLRLRNFIRQGIQLGGKEGDGGHLVTGCRDLEHTVKPGGSTIHVEHAEGGSGFTIEGNYCRSNLLAGGGAHKLVVRDNEIFGRIEGNSIKDGLFENNRLHAQTVTEGAMMQFGYAQGLVIRGNTIEGGDSAATGIYVWGTSKYNPEPSKDVVIEKNVLAVKKQPISLNGVIGARIRENVVQGSEVSEAVLARRSERVEIK